VPQTPPLFPYTTLFRSRGDRPGMPVEGRSGRGYVPGGLLLAQVVAGPAAGAHPAQRLGRAARPAGAGRQPEVLPAPGPAVEVLRSEEHTSELQSLTHLL